MMQATVRAVLARFNGDTTRAAHYCADIAARYPHLKTEYMQLLWTLLS